MLTLTTPAEDYTLLSINEMRAAAGIADATQDEALQAMERRVVDTICTYCNVAIAGSARPTLRRETLTETFRAIQDQYSLVLSRRHNVNVTSVTVDGITLDPDDYDVGAESGQLWRLDEDTPIHWNANKVTVVYAAGFSTAPADLKLAAMDFFRFAWREKDRDPALKSQEVDIPGVERHRVEYWAGSLPGVAESAVPTFVSGQLLRYRNFVV